MGKYLVALLALLLFLFVFYAFSGFFGCPLCGIIGDTLAKSSERPVKQHFVQAIMEKEDNETVTLIGATRIFAGEVSLYSFCGMTEKDCSVSLKLTEEYPLSFYEKYEATDVTVVGKLEWADKTKSLLNESGPAYIPYNCENMPILEPEEITFHHPIFAMIFAPAFNDFANKHLWGPE